jgi:hypothetical protein
MYSATALRDPADGVYPAASHARRTIARSSAMNSSKRTSMVRSAGSLSWSRRHALSSSSMRVIQHSATVFTSTSP